MFSIFYLVGQVLLSVALTIFVSFLMKDDTRQKNKPPSKDSYNFPRAEQGTPINKFFGRIKLAGYTCTNWAILNQERIVLKVKNWFWTEKQETPNFKTYIDLHVVLGMADKGNNIKLRRIWVGDTVVFETTASGSFSGNISAYELYGENNGIGGAFEFWDGSDGQIKSAYLNNGIYQGNASKWKKNAHIIFKNFYMGNGTSAPQFYFELVNNAVPDWCPSGMANYSDETINPAVSIYYTLTDMLAGAKIPDQMLDLTSFATAATELYNEQFKIGYNRQFGRSATDEITDILEVIDANLYTDIFTGQITLKMNNNDYNIDDLIHIQTKDLSKYSSTSTTITTMVSEVRVKYTDVNNNYQSKVAFYKNEATRMKKGRNEVKELNYDIIADYATALKVASREAFYLTNSLISLDLELANRKISTLRSGDVVKISIPYLKIYNMPFRIFNINYGKLKNSKIQVSLIQDRFGYRKAILDSTSPFIPVDRSSAALNCNLKLLEAPAYFNKNMNVVDDVVVTFAERPNSRHQNFELWSNKGSGYIRNGQSTGFCFVGSLGEDLDQTSTSISFTSSYFNAVAFSKDNLNTGQNLAVIVDGLNNVEYINFESSSYSSTTGMYTIQNVNRGLLDTIPKVYIDGDAKIYFISYGMALNDVEYFKTGDNVSFKALTKTSTDKLDIASASNISYTFNSRQDKPISVSNLKVNDIAFVNEQTISMVDLKLNFAYRDKTPSIQYYNVDNTINLDGNTVNIKVYNGLSLLKDVNLISNETQWIFDDETTMNLGNYYTNLRVVVTTMKSSVNSVDHYDIIVKR